MSTAVSTLWRDMDGLGFVNLWPKGDKRVHWSNRCVAGWGE